jgi:hypothetical protein
MLARLVARRVIAKAVLIAALSSLAVAVPVEIAFAKRKLPPGACLSEHHRVVANSSTCMTNCNSAGWCTNMVCTNGQLSALPFPCHSPEACPAARC